MAAQPVDPATLGLLLYRAHQLARGKANDAAAPTGLALHHAAALSAIQSGAVRSQRELGTAIGIDKSTLVRMLDDFERWHLVRRQRAAEDRRAYEIVITEEGEERLREANELYREAMRELLKVFDAKEQRHLHDLLARFADQEG
ncbi:MarR family winged helix-turn-helix transcriptional regulator [Amycolatopsis sp. CA-230715]|uniref:MarR family winged helix-turn-helix transcriptional regulator n=1 Tax=Amycolatopsis sp. CA-230715 TaxID=2745196 RepID=UPI001C00AC6A|nr:MarR family transcriptional regulator [Amycolatopsis sp. CA-230715]